VSNSPKASPPVPSRPNLRRTINSKLTEVRVYANSNFFLSNLLGSVMVRHPALICLGDPGPLGVSNFP